MLEEWKLAYEMEPWGDDWWQAATIAHAASQPHIKKRMRIEDFMPNFKRSAGITDAAQIEKLLMGMCGAAV